MVLDTRADMELPLVWSQCRHEGARWIVAGMIRRQPQYPFENEPAQLCNGRPIFKFCDFVWIGDLGFAGAVTADACVLCAAGTYQTGSGPPRQRWSSTHFILINQLFYHIMPYEVLKPYLRARETGRQHMRPWVINPGWDCYWCLFLDLQVSFSFSIFQHLSILCLWLFFTFCFLRWGMTWPGWLGVQARLQASTAACARRGPTRLDPVRQCYESNHASRDKRYLQFAFSFLIFQFLSIFLFFYFSVASPQFCFGEG